MHGFWWFQGEWKLIRFNLYLDLSEKLLKPIKLWWYFAETLIWSSVKKQQRIFVSLVRGKW